MSKRYLCYWGDGYGDQSHTSKVLTTAEMKELFSGNPEVIDWAETLSLHEETWEFSGPVDEFMIMRVQ